MLKWTVTKRSVESCDSLASTERNVNSIHSRRSLGIITQQNQPLHIRQSSRRSLGFSAKKTPLNLNKENHMQHYTSTPHLNDGISSYVKFESVAFRDVSNITPNSTPKSGLAVTPQNNLRKRTLKLSPQMTSTLKKQQIPSNYASTLPTFDVEYSPCGGGVSTGTNTVSGSTVGGNLNDGCASAKIQTTPFLKMRGVGVADSYYENPRYFSDEIQQPPMKKRKSSSTTTTATASVATPPTITNLPSPAGIPNVTPLSNRLSELRFSKMSFKRNTDFAKNVYDSSMNSSAMGDMTLDKMIDAILESAKKEKWTPRLRRSISIKSNKEKSSKNTSSTYKPADDPANDLKEFNNNNNSNINNNNYKDTTDGGIKRPCDIYLLPENYKEAAERTIILEETTISNEREVRTPDATIQMAKRKSLPKVVISSPIEKYYLKRQKAVRRKQKLENNRRLSNYDVLLNKNGIDLLNDGGDDDINTSSPCDKQQSIINNRIGLTLPNGIPSPATPMYESSYLRKSYDELAQIQTPKEIAFVVESNVKPLPKICTPVSSGQIEKEQIIEDLNGTLNSNNETPEIKSDDLQGCSTPTGSENMNNTRRCLIYSPAISEDSLEKRRSVASSTLSSKYSKCAVVKGSIDLHLFVENNKLYVNVIRCRDLQRTNGQSINAYVKVALLPHDTSENSFQRTAVHRNSIRPYFDHKFQFDLKENDSYKRIQLAVWHRDREFKRSEFLGCTSFPIKYVYKRGEINGSYKLQPQSCLTNPTQPILEMCENSQSSVVDELISAEDGAAVSTSCDGGGVVIDVGINKINKGGEMVEQILLSKKAIHQRDADENLFLRFLELDPPSEGENGTTGCIGGGAGGIGVNSIAGGGAAGVNLPSGMTPFNAQPQSVSAGAALSTVALLQSSSQTTTSGRRLSASSKPILGRTPFTITKKLNRTDDKGFGFSIVWTHPPRIEKVEPNLSADKGGILPGDYVIFVDKHNVVTMPELDILKLIKSQGNTLLLEIFRRPTRQTNGVSLINNNNNINNLASSSVVSNIITSHATNEQQTQPQQQQLIQPQQTPQLQFSNKPPPTTLNLTQPLALQQKLQQPQLQQTQLIKQQQYDNDSLKPSTLGQRSSAACSNASLETTKRRLNLPQVTFSKESILPQTPDDHRRRFLYQLINREQHYISALQFGIERFALPLRDRKDLISQSDHKTLFQNIDELVRISEDILEHLLQDEQEPQIHFASRVYLSKTTAICAAYKKYCNGLKRADCVLVNKSRNSNCDFMHFITVPPVPRKRPDLTTFIHRPLQHFREILKLNQLIASHCRVDSEEQHNFNNVINELQAAYREITVGGGLMEPLGEGRPLLTLQDLESRLVFTKCKPFILAAPGRQWIFGGDLSRVEGRSIKPYWALLFSDILLFAKVSRDRVLFITEEPLSLTNIVDTCFNIRKKNTEFRITIDPNGRTVESPTVHCAPDLSRTPRKNSKRRSIILRAPSVELKAVWQNLLTRQIFLVNAFGSTPLSSPLESPDVMQILIPLADTSTSLNLVDNNNMQNQNHQQVCAKRIAYTPNSSSTSSMHINSTTNTNYLTSALAISKFTKRNLSIANQSHKNNITSSSVLSSSMPVNTVTAGPCFGNKAISEIPELLLTNSTMYLSSNEDKIKQSEPIYTRVNNNGLHNSTSRHSSTILSDSNEFLVKNAFKNSDQELFSSKPANEYAEFNLSSVGRSFIDTATSTITTTSSDNIVEENESVTTPDTPPPNISPSSSSNKNSETFSSDFNKFVSSSSGGGASTVDCNNLIDPETDDNYCGRDNDNGDESDFKKIYDNFDGSWDFLELDLDFHRVNLDPSFVNDVEEIEFLENNDPFGMLPSHPTPPNLLDL